MSATSLTPSPSLRAAPAVLRASAALWFVVAAIGQLAFVYYVTVYFGGRVLDGTPERWNDKPLIEGHTPGDAVGNLMFITHALLAAVITLGGLLQLVPQVRQHAAWFHRLNGRVFVVVAYAMALGGLWLVWVRETYLSLLSALAITLDAGLILAFATLAWRAAAGRRFAVHRRWALRTFMVVSGVWFLRVGVMAWIILNQGPVGMAEGMSGPADIVLIFGSYLIPLAILEAYLGAERSVRPGPAYATAALVASGTVVMAVGIFGTVVLMWGPHL